MMKNNRVFIHNWQGSIGDDYVDIPWPLVHNVAGTELVSWLNRQDPVKVQMVLDRTSDGWQSLWAEFYDDEARTEFALRFAK
jgi:hypothetical protein